MGNPFVRVQNRTHGEALKTHRWKPMNWTPTHVCVESKPRTKTHEKPKTSCTKAQTCMNKPMLRAYTFIFFSLSQYCCSFSFCSESPLRHAAAPKTTEANHHLPFHFILTVTPSPQQQKPSSNSSLAPYHDKPSPHFSLLQARPTTGGKQHCFNDKPSWPHWSR